MRVYKYLNQKVIDEQNGKSFRSFLKTKKHVKRLSFITQFKIDRLYKSAWKSAWTSSLVGICNIY